MTVQSSKMGGDPQLKSLGAHFLYHKNEGLDSSRLLKVKHSDHDDDSCTTASQISSCISQTQLIMSSISERQQELKLQQARQSGQAPPAVDSKTNAIINPHNPEFITKRPWYLGGGDDGPSLDHQGDQRLPENKLELTLSVADELLEQAKFVGKEYQVGMWVEALKNNKMPYRMAQLIKISNKGTEFDLKYEDGSTETKVKLSTRSSKPRIRRTKVGNRAHAIDAKVFGNETYDSKRDAYHGFDRASHLQAMEQKYATRDDIRKQILASSSATTKDTDKHRDDEDGDSDSDVGSDDSEDEFVVKDEDAKTFSSRLARQGGVGGAQMKVTARNLRIREDTAKYLRNLDVNSAYYDPKSRSMRDNPNPEQQDSQYTGDNAARISGDAVGLAETQLFAWDATGSGTASIHPQANPSQAEWLKKEYKAKSTDLMATKKKAVLDKYGGGEYLDGGGGLATATAKPTSDAARKARFGVSVTQEEYTRDGRLLQNGVAMKREALVSKYQENIYSNGHTTVWGSYFHKGAFQWGYADDHSLIRNSYCTGANGKIVNDEANEMRYGTGVAGSAALKQAREMLKAMPDRKVGEARMTGSQLYGDATVTGTLDQDKVQAAMKKLDEDANTDRKRKYNSVGADVDVTEEEMEAYRLQKNRGTADPMADLGGDELLDYK
jgi:pre-mRNA-processing factor SLU7